MVLVHRRGLPPGKKETSGLKRASVGALIAVVALMGLAVRSGMPRAVAQHAPTVAQATGSESLSVTPDTGSISQDFTINGSGFAPGTALDDSYIGPDGNTWVYSGPPLALNPDGSFSEVINIATDFQGNPPSGRWTAQYCYTGTTDCFVVDFLVQ
jgi:hypothetical protein